MKTCKAPFSWSNPTGRKEYSNVAFEKDGELCYGRIAYQRPNLLQVLEQMVRDDLMTPEQATKVIQMEYDKGSSNHKSEDYIAQVQRRARLYMR